MIRKIIILPLIFFIFLAGCVNETPAEKGTIQFTSSPTGAQVYLDSQFRGTTPSTLTGIEPGNHTLEIRYTGYQSWSTVMTVSSGQNNVFIALTPETAASTPGSVTATTPSSGSSALPVSITLILGREQMIIGDSMILSGTAEGCKNVLLTMYGAGAYENGVSIAQPDVGTLGGWSYTWNPGTKLLSGTYIIVVTDPDNMVTVKKEFQVIGGGKVTVISNSYAAARGNTLQFSGLCTTGATTVQLVLYGPGQYAGGVTLGTFSVQANKNWNFAYTLDNTMPTGTYTLYAYDVPKTTSGTTQFTVGYAS
ncbi:PEGA domain-containing protein [Methanoregula sp.]|uniref:PEGA domain-containing protein n=1 Tax=Methanoregula sp. TaxID=2052170 RepID=UPI00236FADE8|nr:PEGA domain-containing protein [Methanoregula sp.]MDD1686145.1 PEGA domain-containing protein [Methanoregula sp.]